jgi:hypothetical protein
MHLDICGTNVQVLHRFQLQPRELKQMFCWSGADHVSADVLFARGHFIQHPNFKTKSWFFHSALFNPNLSSMVQGMSFHLKERQIAASPPDSLERGQSIYKVSRIEV